MPEIDRTSRSAAHPSAPAWPRWKKVLAYLVFSTAAAMAIALVDWKVHQYQ
jgi:hypothetical protein